MPNIFIGDNIGKKKERSCPRSFRLFHHADLIACDLHVFYDRLLPLEDGGAGFYVTV